MVAPGHDYQQFTVYFPFTTAIRYFVCLALASAPGGAAVDASPIMAAVTAVQ